MASTRRDSVLAGEVGDHPIDWAISRTFLKFSLVFVTAGAAAYLAAILLIGQGQELRAALAVTYILVAGVSWLFLSRGQVRRAVCVLGVGLWLCMSGAAVFLGGVASTTTIIYPLIILLAGWMVGRRAAIAVALATVTLLLVLVYAESQAWLPPAPPTLPVMRWIVQAAVFTLTALLVGHFVRAYRARLGEVRKLGDSLAQRAALLEASAADLHRAQALAQVGSWVVDLRNGRMHLSDETCRIYGVPSGTVGDHASHLARVHPDDRAALDAAWRAALADLQPFDFEHRIGNGREPGWVRQQARFERDAAGVALRAVGTTHEITERKRHEAQVLAARSQLAATLDALPDLLFEIGPDGRYHDCHSPRPELLAMPVEQFLGRTIPEVLPAAAAAVCMEALHEANVNGRSHGMSFELSLPPPQGDTWFEISVARKTVAPGQEPRFIFLARDISESKRAQAHVAQLNASLEARVRERTAALEEANRELESFSYTISHDLRGPLRSIVGFAGLLNENLYGQLDDENRACLARIDASGNKMSRLIDGVLDYSRLARSSFTRRDIDLDALVADISGELRERYPDGEIVQGPLGRANADPTMLRQIFHNLIDNGLKYSSKNPQARVEIGARTGATGVEYFVRDNGIGFDMKHAEHLYKLFTRLHSDPDFESTGAGLAIVKRLVERHGGAIRAEAQAGHGATFSFAI